MSDAEWAGHGHPSQTVSRQWLASSFHTLTMVANQVIISGSFPTITQAPRHDINQVKTPN
jgi:hypothetical protein